MDTNTIFLDNAFTNDIHELKLILVHAISKKRFQ